MRPTVKSTGPGKPSIVPSPGATPSAGPSGAAPAPRAKKNTRDYGKAAVLPTPPPIKPFGAF